MIYHFYVFQEIGISPSTMHHIVDEEMTAVERSPTYLHQRFPLIAVNIRDDRFYAWLIFISLLQLFTLLLCFHPAVTWTLTELP
jgi:hypothetical protein